METSYPIVTMIASFHRLSELLVPNERQKGEIEISRMRRACLHTVGKPGISEKNRILKPKGSGGASWDWIQAWQHQQNLGYGTIAKMRRERGESNIIHFIL
eukprot:scaffold124483_cov37-Attheya_sp.AAC.1